MQREQIKTNKYVKIFVCNLVNAFETFFLNFLLEQDSSERKGIVEDKISETIEIG